MRVVVSIVLRNLLPSRQAKTSMAIMVNCFELTWGEVNALLDGLTCFIIPAIYDFYTWLNYGCHTWARHNNNMLDSPPPPTPPTPTSCTCRSLFEPDYCWLGLVLDPSYLRQYNWNHAGERGEGGGGVEGSQLTGLIKVQHYTANINDIVNNH